MKKVFWSILFLLLLAAAAGWIALVRFQQGQLYHPTAEIATTPAQYRLRSRRCSFSLPTAPRSTGWWIPANRPRGTVVYCHGNAGNIGGNAHIAPEFFKRGFNLLLWDYRGYGKSGGRPSEQGLYDDASAAYDAAAAMSGKLPIVVYGNSLGGAVAVQLAKDRPGRRPHRARLVCLRRRHGPPVVSEPPPRPPDDRLLRFRGQSRHAGRPAQAVWSWHPR